MILKFSEPDTSHPGHKGTGRQWANFTTFMNRSFKCHEHVTVHGMFIGTFERSAIGDERSWVVHMAQELNQNIDTTKL